MIKGVPIALKEKLIVDCVAHPKYTGGIDYVYKLLLRDREKIDVRKLVNFGLLERPATRRRLAYLAWKAGFQEDKLQGLLKGVNLKKSLPLDQRDYKLAGLSVRHFGVVENYSLR